MTRRGLAVVGLAALVACGGGGTGYGVFSTNWNDDDGKSIDEVEKKLAGVPIPLGADVAVGVAGHGSRLVGAPLAGGSRWSFAHAIDARPVVAGGVVVGSGGNEVFAVDALTGKLLWHLPTGGLALHGAGDDGTVSVVTMSRAAGRGSTLLAVAHDGMVLRRIDPSVSLGAPAVVNRIAFVPWDNQYVSALDVTDGAEVGRLLLREKTSHAWTSGGALYFGELGLFRFDAKIKNASRGGADHVALPAKALPGHPVLFQPGDWAVAASSGAADKVRLYARPTAPTEVLAIADGRFYATYFRLLYGLTVSPRAALSWVHTHADAIVGGAAAAGGFIACDEAGKVTTFDAGTGATLGGVIDLGEPVESCVVSADGLRATGAPHDALPLVEQYPRGAGRLRPRARGGSGALATRAGRAAGRSGDGRAPRPRDRPSPRRDRPRGRARGARDPSLGCACDDCCARQALRLSPRRPRAAPRRTARPRAPGDEHPERGAGARAAPLRFRRTPTRMCGTWRSRSRRWPDRAKSPTSSGSSRSTAMHRKPPRRSRRPSARWPKRLCDSAARQVERRLTRPSDSPRRTRPSAPN